MQHGVPTRTVLRCRRAAAAAGAADGPKSGVLVAYLRREKGAAAAASAAAAGSAGRPSAAAAATAGPARPGALAAAAGLPGPSSKQGSANRREGSSQKEIKRSAAEPCGSAGGEPGIQVAGVNVGKVGELRQNHAGGDSMPSRHYTVGNSCSAPACRCSRRRRAAAGAGLRRRTMSATRRTFTSSACSSPCRCGRQLLRPVLGACPLRCGACGLAAGSSPEGVGVQSRMTLYVAA